MSPHFFATFTNGDNFCDIQFPSLDEEDLPKWSLLLEERICTISSKYFPLTLLHSEQPKLYRVLAVLSAIGLKVDSH